MLNRKRELAVWDRVCANGGQQPHWELLHAPTHCRRKSCLTPTLQLITLLRLLLG